MTEGNATSDNPAGGPICPNCQQALEGNLRQQEISPTGTARSVPGLPMAVTYCGSCGWTLHLAPAQAGFAAGRMLHQEVAAPIDERSLQGQFQVRCRELIGETRSLGFDPNVWVPMINDLGAVGAAKKLLADHQRLVATPWLVGRGRPELTLEHEIGQPRWAALFTDDERAEAARRLANARGTAPL